MAVIDTDAIRSSSSKYNVHNWLHKIPIGALLLWVLSAVGMAAPVEAQIDVVNTSNTEIQIDGNAELDGSISTTTAFVGSTTYLFVASVNDDTISSFSIADDGDLDLVDSVVDDSTLNLDGVQSVTTAVVGGTTYLFAAGFEDDGVSVFSVSNNGTLTNVSNFSDTAGTFLWGTSDVTTAAVNGSTYLFVTGFWDDGISVFSVANNGSLTNADNVRDNSTLELDGARSVTTTVVNGVTYLFAAGEYDDGVSVFSVANDGTLTNVANVSDGGALQLRRAYSVTTSVVNGTTYLFAAGQHDDGVSVFSVANNGTLTNVANVSDGGALELDGVQSVTISVVNGTTYLFVAGRNDDGVSVFSVANDGSLTNVDNVTDDASLELDGARSVTTAEVNGVTYLFVLGFDGVSVFSVANNGRLTNVDNVADDAPFRPELIGFSGQASAIVGTNQFLFTTGEIDDGISVFSVANDGTLTNVANVSDGGALELDGVQSVTTAVVGGTTYLFAAGVFDDGVSVFSVANDGSLTNVDNVADDATLELDGAWSVTSAEVNGVTYLFVSGLSDDGVSVFSVANNGRLTNVDNVADDATLELDGVRSVTTAQVNGTTYLFAAGDFDSGVSVFSVANDGTLTNVENVNDSGSLELLGPRGVTTTEVNGVTYLFVASHDDDGVSVFSVANDGTLTNVDNVANDATLELDGAWSVAAAEVNGTAYLFAAGEVDDGVSVFSIANDGSLTNVANVADSAVLFLDRPRTILTLDAGGSTYLFTGGFSDWGLSSFSIGNNGELTNVENIDGRTEVLLRRPWSVTTASVGGLTYLFSASETDDGISVFSVGANGILTNAFNISDDFELELNGAISVATAEVNDTTYLFAAGYFDSGVSVFSVANDGTLTNVDNVADSGALELGGTWSVTTAEVNGVTYLFASSRSDSGVSVFSVANDGTLTNVENVADDATLYLNQTRGAATAVVNGTTYLFAAGYVDDGVSVFSVANDGSLTNVDNVADDASLELDGAWAVTTAEVNGVTYLFVASHDDDGVSVFSVGNDGSLTNVDNLSDYGDKSLNGAWSLTTASLDNRTYLFAGGEFDRGVSIFMVEPDGALTPVIDLNADQSLPIGNISSLATTLVSGEAYLFATSLNFDRISTFSVKLTNPRIASISRQNPIDGLTNADSVTWRVAFNENVLNVDPADFSVSGTTGTINVNAISANTFDVTVSGGDMASLTGTVTLSLAPGQNITDPGQYALSNTVPLGSNNNSYNLDNAVPTLDITGPSGPVSAAFTATFTFDEDVAGFVVGDITVGNGAASNFQTTSASVYTATITPVADGAVTVDVADSVAIDDAANANTAATRFSVTNDATPPTLAITGPGGALSGAFTATFTFSEDVTGFAAGDIFVGNGAASNFQATSATVYTATITPAGDGSVTVDIAGSAATDAAGNGNTAATRFSVTADVTAPTVAITGPAGPVSGAFTATFTFSEAVTGFVLADLTVGNGAPSNFQATSATVYTATITPTADGAVTVDVADSVATDAAGNDNTAATQFSVTNDATAPGVASIARSNPSSELNNGDSLTWLVRFSSDVENVDAADFAVSGTTATVTRVSPQAVPLPPSVTGNGYSAPSALSRSAFEVTASGGDLASYNGVVTLSFAGAQNITDNAGNALTNTTPTGANEASYTLDNTAPTVALTTTAAASVSSPFTVTATFSEDVTGFDVSDLTVTNGTASNLQATSATVYTATITPGSGTAVAVLVAANGASDAAGNGNTGSTPLALGHDPDRTLTVLLLGVGAGAVSSTPAGIDCGTDCSEDYALGTVVTLTATADTGSSFDGWTTGPCIGTSTATCAVTMTGDTIASARFTLDAPPAGRIVAATLPGARSGYVGGPAITALMSVVSRTTSPAQSCQAAAPAGAPVGLTYQQLDGAGAPTGPQNPLFDIDAGGSLDFVIAMSPDRQTSTGGYEFMPVIACQNASLDPIVGISSVLLTIGAAPTPDILSIAATPSNDGVIRIPRAGGVGFMTASAVNIGVGDGSAGANEITMTASVDTGAATLPLNLEICQIDAASICITPRSSNSITSTMTGSDPLFFAVFVRDTSTGGIPFDPANSRVFLRFADATGTIRSATSAAVTAPAPEAAPEIASSLPQGRWSVLMRQPEGIWPGLARTSLFVMEDGTAVIDDGRDVRFTTIEAIAADNDTDGAQARFMALGHDGLWTSSGAIRLGAPWADTAGEFWGVRDARSDSPVAWTDLAGPFGNSLILSETGEIRGRIEDCAVYGQASGLTTQPVSLTLSGCAQSGFYLGLIDLPANDNDTPLLLVANEAQGWRVER